MLYNKIIDYTKSGVYPMHMPGHKRNPEFAAPELPYGIDITEIYGFDDLHSPQGVLLETAMLASELYGSEKSFPLVNGSTVGILTAIGAHASRGEKILTTLNCHRSVYNASSLFGLTPVCITPETDSESGVIGSVTPEAVEAALFENPDISLVVVTSPSYEGVISDIRSISEITRQRGVPMLVDAAHGAHLGFSPGFPGSPVKEGADVVVMSLHKTLPALTQCSLLHVCGERANTPEIKRLLSVLQTSSPSYVLMASIDRCLRLISTDKEKLFSAYERYLARFYGEMAALQKLSMLIAGRSGVFFDLDPGKIVIVTKNTSMSGYELSGILRNDYSIELELACDGCAIAMTSICDSPDGFKRLAEALLAVDSTI